MDECLICFSPRYKGSDLARFFYHDDLLCCDCRRQMLPDDYKFKLGNITVEGIYLYEGFVRSLLLQYKELGDEALAAIFLYPYLKKLRKKYHDYIMVAIPSSALKKEARGFNHVDLLFRDTGLTLIDVLLKETSTEQKTKSFHQRGEITFSLNNPGLISGQKVLIIDDIVTSGSSMIRAAELLTAHAAEVTGFTISIHSKLLKEEL